jgi:linoleoyl-CoA desaturase
MQTYQTIRFTKTNRDFQSTLNKRIHAFFKENNLERYGNIEMQLKTLFMFSLYFAPFIVFLSGGASHLLIAILLWVLMGIGLAGIGLSVMHDACHQSYSRKKWKNDLLAYSLNMLGASSFNWRLQHNVLHHTFTNVHEVDEDIDSRGILRLSPESPLKGYHRFQHIYAWILYGLMTFVWVFVKDFIRLKRYVRNGLVDQVKANSKREWAILIITKVVYLSYILALPLLITDYPWYYTILGFASMHYVAGLALAAIFQPAHVTPETDFPNAHQTGLIENSFAAHQLSTTKNFAMNSRAFSWFVGGLNYQVEHHLFPHICHVHYRKISPIVAETAREFNLPYYSDPTFIGALRSHTNHLKRMGRGN